MMYEWIKIGHIIALISWMAGLFYLPRLLIYHTESAKGSDKSETFKIMERRLLKVIMTPAMILTWIFGLGLAGILDVWSDIWFNLKLALVIGMTVFHFLLSNWVKQFVADNNQKSQKYFRIANEVPTVVMMLIVFLVVMKPF